MVVWGCKFWNRWLVISLWVSVILHILPVFRGGQTWAATTETHSTVFKHIGNPALTRRSPPEKVSQINATSARCFLDMRFGDPGEGIAGLFRLNSAVLAASVKYGCPYVCRQNPSWKVVHSIGSVHDLFGCLGGGKTVGSAKYIVPAASVKHLPVVKAAFVLNDNFIMRWKGHDKIMTGLGVSLLPKPGHRMPPTVYHLRVPSTFKVHTFELTYPWLRSQYASARSHARRTVGIWGNASWRIVLQLRRGDRPLACPLGIYLNALRHLLKSLPYITASNSKIILIGELDQASAEFQTLRHFPVVFLAGKKQMDKGAKARLTRDLDYVATSNILILGGGGSFPCFAASLQADGIILHARLSKDLSLEGLPHAHELDRDGRFTCAFDFADFVARVIGHGHHRLPMSN